MSEANYPRLAKRLRLAARVIGLVVAGFLLSILTVEGISDVLTKDWEAIVIEGILLGIHSGRIDL